MLKYKQKYCLFTLRKSRSPLRTNGDRGFRKVNWLYMARGWHQVNCPDLPAHHQWPDWSWIFGASCMATPEARCIPEWWAASCCTLSSLIKIYTIVVWMQTKVRFSSLSHGVLQTTKIVQCHTYGKYHHKNTSVVTIPSADSRAKLRQPATVIYEGSFVIHSSVGLHLVLIKRLGKVSFQSQNTFM